MGRWDGHGQPSCLCRRSLTPFGATDLRGAVRRRRGTKRGLAAALHSGDPAVDALPGYFYQRLEPALGSLLEAATAAGEIRDGVSARDLLTAIALLCTPVGDREPAYGQRMVDVLIDGLRYPAPRATRM